MVDDQMNKLNKEIEKNHHNILM